MFKKYRFVVALVMVGVMSGGMVHTVDASASMGNESVQSPVERQDKTVNHTYDDAFVQFFNQFFSKGNQQKKSWEDGEKITAVEPEAPKQPEVNVEEESEAPSKNQVKEEAALHAFEQEVFALTNEERVKNGLEPFEIHLELSNVAKEKSRDISVNNYFAHNSPTYGSPFDMMQAFGIDYRTAGENIAQGQTSPAEVVNAWMNSPGHRANILNSNFTHIGLGYIENKNVWTQQFIGR